MNPTDPHRFRRNILALLAAGLLVAGVVVGLHFYQERTEAALTRQAQRIRQARVDMAEGFLHALMPADSGAPFERGRGIALLEQGMDSLEAIATRWTEDQRSVRDLGPDLLQLRRLLSAVPEVGPVPVKTQIALRIAFHQVQKQSEQLDDAVQAARTRQMATQDRLYLLVLALSALLMAAMALLVYVSDTRRSLAEVRRMAAEEELRKNETRLRLLVEHAPAALAMFDKDMRYVTASRRWLDDYGLHGQEIIGRSHYAVFPEISADWKDVHRRALAGEVVHREQDQFVRADGSVQWLRWEVRPWRGEGDQIGGIVVFTEDVTEQKRGEDEIHRLNLELERRVEQRTAELISANKEIEAFSYSVSHDLRAPLRAIDGFLRIILEEQADRLDETGKGYLKRVVAAADKMAQLIDDLLNLAKINRAELTRQPTDLAAVARAILGELASHEPGRRVDCVVPDSLQVSGDPRLLGVLLQNLLGNAWKFTAKHASARIELGTAPAPEGRRICFVRDNGAGFDMAYAHKLFKAFQRLHHDHEFPGTGIGLATVHRIVTRHGGRVWMESKVGEGTTCFFELPAA